MSTTMNRIKDTIKNAKRQGHTRVYTWIISPDDNNIIEALRDEGYTVVVTHTHANGKRVYIEWSR